MSKPKHLDHQLREWEYEFGEVLARKVRGSDRRQVLQLRIDLGIMQLELQGRPDGRRPGNCDTYYDYLVSLAFSDGEGFELDGQRCQEIDREFVQFYYRRIAWLALREFDRAVADADHTLALMDFSSAYSPDEEWAMMHEHGRAVARELAADLARAGAVVVSGLARGVDACAHLGALEAGGRTVAVQGCGPDRVYPAAHRELAARIAGSGALLSEFPPGTPPRGPHFPMRNRLISGLCRALIVVEARQRSGSLVTARHALDQGIEVFAVPGPVNAPTSEGTNRLLRDGAYVVLEAADVLRELGLPRGGEPARARAARDSDSPILRLLEERPRTRDELARALEEPPERLALALLELELEGLVAEDRDGLLRAIPRELC